MKRSAKSQWIFIILWLMTLTGALAVWGMVRVQEHAAQHLISHLQRVQHEIIQERWPEALEEIKGARTTWEYTRRRWALYTDHAEMDVVTDALVDAQAKIFMEETDAYASLSLAIDRIKTLPEREHLVLENLF